jgi:hypothetical protein
MEGQRKIRLRIQLVLRGSLTEIETTKSFGKLPVAS